MLATGRLGVVCRFALMAVCLGGAVAHAEPGVSATQIVLGMSTAMTGPIAVNGTEFSAGALLHFDRVNREGGIHGRKVVLEILDDAYAPARTAENVKKLVFERQVFALFGVLGTDNSVETLKIATPNKVPFLFPVTGDESTRKEPNRYFFTVTASLNDEIDKIVEHLTTNGVRSIAVAHLANGFGNSLLGAALQSLEKRGLKAVATAAFDVSGKEAPAAAEKLAKARPDAIIVAALGRSASDFVAAYKKTGAEVQFLSFSGVGSDLLVKTLGASSYGIVISQNMPFPWASSVPVVRDYLTLKKAKGEASITYMNLRGFIAARVMTEGLKRAGKATTREKLVEAMESMRQVDLGGYVVSFSPQNHHGSHFVDLTIIGRDGKFLK